MLVADGFLPDLEFGNLGWLGGLFGVIGLVVSWFIARIAKKHIVKAGHDFEAASKKNLAELEKEFRRLEAMRSVLETETEKLAGSLRLVDAAANTLRVSVEKLIPDLGDRVRAVDGTVETLVKTMATAKSTSKPANVDGIATALRQELASIGTELATLQAHNASQSQQLTTLVESLGTHNSTNGSGADSQPSPLTDEPWTAFLAPRFAHRRPPLGNRDWRSIAFYNHKGGVGKTTLAFNVAHSLAHRYGKRVLLVDSDAQANLSLLTLGAEEIQDLTPNQVVGGMLRARHRAGSAEGTSLLDWAQKTKHCARCGHEKVRIVPNKAAQMVVEDHLVRVCTEGDDPRGWWLEWLSGDLGFDFVIFDCPPNLGFLAQASLAASDFVFVPVTPSELVMQGVKQLRAGIVEWRKLLGESDPDPITGIVLNRFEEHEHEKYVAHFQDSVHVMRSWLPASDTYFRNARTPWSVEIDATKSSSRKLVQQRLEELAGEVLELVGAAKQES